MAVDTMRVRLHLRLIRVLTVLVDTPTRLDVEVASTRSWSRCPFCGFKTRTVYDRRQRKIRDLPVSGRRMTLVWIRRRFSCGNCDERHLEDHLEFENKLTRRLARRSCPALPRRPGRHLRHRATRHPPPTTVARTRPTLDQQGYRQEQGEPARRRGVRGG